jgi:hypothetical protein
VCFFKAKNRKKKKLGREERIKRKEKKKKSLLGEERVLMETK